MALIALGSLRSPGVTTSALALARTWPEDRSVVLAEVDPAGGTLAGTLGLRPEPGLQSLAAAARHGGARHALDEHAQALSERAAVLLAPPTSEQTSAALAMLGDLPALFRAASPIDASPGDLPLDSLSPGDPTPVDPAPADLLCDCGRLDVASPVLSLFSSADLALVVVRRELSDLHVLWASLDGRGLAPGRFGGRLGVLLVGDGPYGTTEVEEAIGAPVLGTLPHDPAGVRALVAELPRPFGLRSALPRTARTLAASLLARLTSEHRPEPGQATSDVEPVAAQDDELNMEARR